jgi:ADP-heptose:LPS heptosyltransferase
MKILIVQPRRIGDVIVTTPVIDVLRRHCPEAQIDFLVEPGMAPVLDRYPGLTERLVFEKSKFWFWLREIRRRRYDWVLDFMNNPRTAQLTWYERRAGSGGVCGSLFGALPTRTGFPARTGDLYAVQNKFQILRRLGVPVPDFALPRSAVGSVGNSSRWTSGGADVGWIK